MAKQRISEFSLKNNFCPLGCKQLKVVIQIIYKKFTNIWFKNIMDMPFWGCNSGLKGFMKISIMCLFLEVILVRDNGSKKTLMV